MSHLTSLLNVHTAYIFEKYLGLPMQKMHPKSSDYQYILDRMHNRQQGWKTKFLNLAGHATLIRFVLNSLHAYVMQNQLLPLKTRENNDKIQQNFLWGSTPNHQKIHLIKRIL